MSEQWSGVAGGGGTTEPARLVRVDTEVIAQARSAHDEVASAMAQVRRVLRELVAAAPAWAADSQLLPAVRSLAETLDAAALRNQQDAAALGVALVAAGRRYQDAEAAALAERRPR